MKITLFLALHICAIATNGYFLNTKKPTDGCNPSPCKNDGKCEVLSINKMLAMCDCQPGYHGNICDKKTGCHNSPCKHGTCRDDSRNPSNYHCTCDHGYVGTNCDTKNQCVAKNPCAGQSVCSLDHKFNPVCKCPSGFMGSKCDKRNCTVVQFKGHNFEQADVYIAAEVEPFFKKLDGLAKICEVRIQHGKSFVLQQYPNMIADPANAAFYVGRALKFTLNDAKGKLVCGRDCLGKFPIPEKRAGCFINGLKAIGFTYSSWLPGETHVDTDGFHLADHVEYNNEKQLKQIGCQLEKKLAKSNVVILDSSSLLKCPFGKTGIKCEKVNLCDTKNPCKVGTVCELDHKFDPKCICAPGLGGKQCEKKICTIIEFKGKNFEKKPIVLIDIERKKLFEELDNLAGKCEVVIAPLRSFNLQSNLNDSTIGKDSPFYVGRGLELELHDKKGRLLCNSFCLGKSPVPLAQAKCFIDGLAPITWRHSIYAPGILNDGSHIFDPDGYNKARVEKQNGCRDMKFKF